MFCAISGDIPEEPVVSRKSGLLFERRLIEKALTATGGKCPETGEELNSDDLIAVKTSGAVARPVPASAASFPGLLAHLQSDWDALMLESHNTKKLLSKTRQELAHALYQYDAATRVISKLIAEKEELQQLLNKSYDAAERASQAALAPSSKRKLDEANGAATDEPTAKGDPESLPDAEPEPKRLKEAGGGAAAPKGVTMEPEKAQEEAADAVVQDPVVLPSPLKEEIEKQSSTLRTRRKARKPSPNLAEASGFQAYVDIAQSAQHSESPCTSIVFLDDDRVATGALDGTISILNATSLKHEETRDCGIDGVKRGVSCLTRTVKPGIFVSGGDDGVVRVWKAEAGKSQATYTVQESSGIVDVAVHPNDSMLFSYSDDGSWTLRDIEANTVLSTRVGGRHVEKGMHYRSGAVHPDGALFSTGCANGVTEIWDMRTMKVHTKLADESITGSVGVSGLCMSENGYYMASAINGTVVIWDLRKYKIAKALKIQDRPAPMAVCIDYSGLYGCAVSTNRHVVFSTKKKQGVLCETEYGSSGDKVDAQWRRPGVGWEKDARALLCGHADGSVHRYSIGDVAV